jgi:ectoine hydroxylase-related dioxygenase (phytanoyl-CoA dioxygenase family)
MTTGTSLVTGADVEAYERDGAICLRQVIPDAWVARMQDAVDRIMRSPSPYSKSPGDQEGRFHNDFFIWDRDDDFHAYAFESPAADIASAVMRTDTVELFFDHLLVKQPRAEEPTPWHHDLPYWPVSGDQVCSVWLALDPVSRINGAIEYLAGSHRWGRRFEPATFIRDRPFDDQGLEQIPDIDAHRDEYRMLTWDLEPGDCLVHHALTVHGAPGNVAPDRRRRGLSTRWTGPDARYDPHPGTFRLLRDPGIPAGATMRCDLFPRVRPRP